jgi:hypothetical protein
MRTRSDLFPYGALAAAAIALVVATATAFNDDREQEPASDGAASTAPAAPVPSAAPVDLDDGAVADPGADPEQVVADAAVAMGGVTSVEFRLAREGAPVFVDQFESIALDAAVGQFQVPTRAQASLEVTVDGNLRTRIGAVAIDSEVWMSNPVTGRFETLPDGYDIDPSRFFDPSGGWQPLLADLTAVEMVGVADRGGQRWHVRGTAAAADVENITVGLVRDQDVVVDLWVHPGTTLVTAIEFDTELEDGRAHWTLELDRYGETFTITEPEGV